MLLALLRAVISRISDVVSNMARALLPCFTTPPFSVVADYLAKDEDFLADAGEVLGLEDSVCAALEMRWPRRSHF